MDIKLNLPATKCCDWNELFSQRYHRMFRVSDLDNWDLKEKSIDLIKKQIRSNNEIQNLEMDETKFVLPEKKTLAIKGMGYWIGSLQWNRTNDSSDNTEITGVLSKYWLTAPVAVVGLAIAIWFFKDVFGFLKPLGEYSVLYTFLSIIAIAGIGVLSYFVHYWTIKNVIKQITVFLKYKGVSYEFEDDVFDAEKAFEEARQEYEQALREARKQIPRTSKPRPVQNYIPQTIASTASATVAKPQPTEDAYHVDLEDQEFSPDTITQDYETDFDTAQAIAIPSDQPIGAHAVEEITEDYTPSTLEATDDSETELPVVEEITEDFDTDIVDDIDFSIPEIDEIDNEAYVEEKGISEQNDEKIQLMGDSALQTVEMKEVEDFDSEIDGGINLVDDSAFSLERQQQYDKEANDETFFDDADATHVEGFDEEILSPDDAFAQGFSPQVLSDEEIVIDDDFEIPEISEENIEDDDIVETVEIASNVEETETDVVEELEDDYKIEIEDEEDFGEEFDTKHEVSEQENVNPEIIEMERHFDEDEDALSEISEMTDTFEVPEIAEDYIAGKTIDDISEPNIPDEFVESEITEDMGVTDEDIANIQDEENSVIFDVPEISESDEDTVIPEDFMVPEIDEEDDGFENTSDYIIQELADKDNATSIEAYGDSFQNEEDETSLENIDSEDVQDDIIVPDIEIIEDEEDDEWTDDWK